LILLPKIKAVHAPMHLLYTKTLLLHCFLHQINGTLNGLKNLVFM